MTVVSTADKIKSAPSAEAARSSLTELEFKRGDELQERDYQWLWYARLLRGAVSLLEGPPEKAKTTILCTIAATISRGRLFPDELPCEEREPADVVMLVAEDDLETTILPRLRAAGADLSRIHILTATKVNGQPQPFQFTDDAERLREKVEETGATLVTVDPLVAYIGSRYRKGVETNNDYSTRQSLLPLAALAEKTRASVLAVRHYKKGHGIDAVEAGGGSIAFSAVARVLLACLDDPNDPDKYLFAVGKNNNVPKRDRPSLQYEIVSWKEKPSVAKIEWGGKVDISAGEILKKLYDKRQAALSGPRKQSLEDQAKDWLIKFLGSAEKPAADALAAADDDGISASTLKRAKAKLDVLGRKDGNGGWFWKMPI